MDEVSDAEKQAEAESWKRWQKAWGNTESGAHAFGWAACRAYERAAQQGERERLRVALEFAAAFWRPVARDMEHGILTTQTVHFLAQDFLAELHRLALAEQPAPGADRE